MSCMHYPARVLGSLQQCWGLHHTLPPQDQKLPSTYGKHTVLSICGLLFSVLKSGIVSYHFC